MKKIFQKNAHRVALGINATTLKIIAAVLMFINHLGYLLTVRLDLGPEWLCELQWIVTRGAFVIFAFLLSEGLVHTRSRCRYLGRIFLFALIAEPCFDLFVAGSFWSMTQSNVLWTMLLAGIGICTYEMIAEKRPALAPAGLLALLLSAVCAKLLCTDYGCFGVLMIYAFYFLRGHRATALLLAEAFLVFGWWNTTEWWGFLVFPLLWFYNGEKGGTKKPSAGTMRQRFPFSRLFFYIFYPLHLLLLAIAYFLATGTYPLLS